MRGDGKGKEERKGRKITVKRAKLEGEKDRKVQKEKADKKKKLSKKEVEEKREEWWRVAESKTRER